MDCRSPAAAADTRPVAAIYRSPLFNDSETFVQAHAAGLTRYQPLLVGLEDRRNARAAFRERMLVAGTAEALRLKLAGSAPRLTERLRRTSPALIHAHFATDGLLALPLARALGVPLVTTLHGYDVARTRRRMFASARLSWMRYAVMRRRLIAGGDLFLAVSDAVRRQALALGFPADRTHTHYLGVDLERFGRGDSAPEPGLVLHVARLVEKKGTALLLDAFTLLRRTRPEARLVIVGDGPERAALERKRSALGLENAVSFAGRLPQDEVAGCMRRAWLLAAPSLTARDGDAEGLPTAIVEAAAASLPAVGSDHSGIPEAIVDGETGFIVPERDPAALAQRLDALLGSAELRLRMGIAARKLAEERFDARRQNRLLEERYDGLLRQIRP